MYKSIFLYFTHSYNFKIINDMLVWEPINFEEIQYRIN